MTRSKRTNSVLDPVRLEPRGLRAGLRRVLCASVPPDGARLDQLRLHERAVRLQLHKLRPRGRLREVWTEPGLALNFASVDPDKPAAHGRMSPARGDADADAVLRVRVALAPGGVEMDLEAPSGLPRRAQPTRPCGTRAPCPTARTRRGASRC